MGKQAIENSEGRFGGFKLLPENITIIGRDTKHKSREEHRLWDERAFTEPDENDRLLRSIRKYGVREAITITKDGDEIIAVNGRQRIIRARMVNKERLKAGATKDELIVISCVYEKVSDEDALGLMITLNIHQEEDPMVLAKKVQDYVKFSTPEKAAESAGVTVQTIQQWLSLPTLHPKVQQAIADHRITPTNAAKLAVLKKEDQVTEMEKSIASGTSSRELAVRVAAVKKATRSGKTAADVKDEDAIVAPKRRLAKKVIAAAQAEKMFSFDETALARWGIGDLAIGSVKKGFADLVHRVESGKYGKKAKKGKK